MDSWRRAGAGPQHQRRGVPGRHRAKTAWPDGAPLDTSDLTANLPVPPFLVDLLAAHRGRYPAGAAGEVFTNSTGGPLRRSMFRSREWRPALVRAGLLGKVTENGTGGFRAEWPDPAGLLQVEEFASYREAVKHVARNAAGGVRFHDLQHSYATWLVSDGVPVNEVQRVMGHESATTTLALYTPPHAAGISGSASPSLTSR